MKKIFIFIFSFCLLGNIFVYPRNYDVLKYDFSVDWVVILNSNKGEPEKREWTGKMKITLTPTIDSLVEIELDAVKLQINNVYFNMHFDTIATTYTITDEFLTIQVPTIRIEDTICLIIDYTYNNPYNKGFSYRNSSDTFPNSLQFDIDAPSAGTLSQPQDARYWMPCNDVPNDKALWNIEVTVPVGMQAASIGTLTGTRSHFDDEVLYAETFYWSSEHPLPPYLMTIAVADYELNIERVQINSTDTDSIDVYYYTFPGDWEAENSLYDAKRVLATTEKIIQMYSDLFGNYPFEKYGFATVDYAYLGHQSIGMEHQTLTTTNRFWVRNFIAVPEYTAYAHELAHHWFGNMVTCNEWSDIWFNEGAATWLEGIYLERILDNADTTIYFNFMNTRRASYIRYINTDVTGTFFEIPIGKIENADSALFRYSVLIYAKASFIFHHLKTLLGDEIFPLLRRLLEQYKFGNISTDEFIDFFVTNVPNPPYNIDLKKYIEQFIIYGGHPRYIVNTNIKIEDNFFAVNMNLKQSQQKTDEVLDDYLMYIKINFLDDNNNLIKSEYIINDKQEQEYEFILDSEPKKIIFDTSWALIEIIENNITSIFDNSSNIINIFPNPTFSNNEITIISDNYIESVIVTDLQGNMVLNDLQIKGHSDNKYSLLLPKITTGTYFILINENNIYKLIINE